MRKYDVIHKPEVHKISQRRQRRTEPRPAQKFGKDRMCSSGDMIADRQTHTDRQIDRHAHHNTLFPNRGRSNKMIVSYPGPIGGSGPSCWEGPNLPFRVRGKGRKAEAQRAESVAGVLGEGERGRSRGGQPAPAHQLWGLRERSELPQRVPGRSSGR